MYLHFFLARLAVSTLYGKIASWLLPNLYFQFSVSIDHSQRFIFSLRFLILIRR